MFGQNTTESVVSTANMGMNNLPSNNFVPLIFSNTNTETQQSSTSFSWKTTKTSEYGLDTIIYNLIVPNRIVTQTIYRLEFTESENPPNIQEQE
jgi:hypothetical protein